MTRIDDQNRDIVFSDFGTQRRGYFRHSGLVTVGILTGEDVHDDAGDVVVRAATGVLAGIGHFAVPHRNHGHRMVI